MKSKKAQVDSMFCFYCSSVNLFLWEVNLAESSANRSDGLVFRTSVAETRFDLLLIPANFGLMFST
jgi:hypothetical protein